MPRAAERADDARRHRVLQAERVADRDHEVADLQPVRIAERDVGQAFGLDLEQRDVDGPVGADHLAREIAPVPQRDRDLAWRSRPRGALVTM